MSTRCKSCGTELIWVLTSAGKATPVDAKPTRVALLKRLDDGQLKIEDAIEGHVSHWATCPHADKHRRRD